MQIRLFRKGGSSSKPSAEVSLIGAESVFEGAWRSEEDIRIEGRL